jgi:hypothetical protein
MHYSKHKQRRARTFQPELLERRELLSAVGLPGHQAADVAPLAKVPKETIKGTMIGTAVVSPITSLAGTTSFGAAGTLSILGVSSLAGSDSYKVTKHDTIKYTDGVSTLSDDIGDTITATFKGSGKEKSAVDFTYKDRGKVTGGTGAYAGATGTVTSSGTFNSLTGAFSITVKVTLTHA